MLKLSKIIIKKNSCRNIKIVYNVESDERDFGQREKQQRILKNQRRWWKKNYFFYFFSLHKTLSTN